jgi:hypothetical protein
VKASVVWLSHTTRRGMINRKKENRVKKEIDREQNLSPLTTKKI